MTLVQKFQCDTSMSRNNPKIIYDAASKVLSVEIEKKKSVDSDIQGNVVIDYDKQGKIVRINLYDFSHDWRILFLK